MVDLYQVDIAPECTSAVTEEVMEEVTAWQQWSLETCYPVVFDALRVKIRSLHGQLRKIIKSRRHFPSDEAAIKLLYLALRNSKKRWHAAPAWQAALVHFAILFPGRFHPEPRFG